MKRSQIEIATNYPPFIATIIVQSYLILHMIRGSKGFRPKKGLCERAPSFSLSDSMPTACTTAPPLFSVSVRKLNLEPLKNRRRDVVGGKYGREGAAPAGLG